MSVKIKLAAILSVVIYCSAVGASEPQKKQVTGHALDALFQGNIKPAKELISKIRSKTKELQQLEILYFLELDDIDTAEDKMVIYEERYSQEASTFSFSSEIWRTIGNKASIFSKIGFYKRAVKSRITAGNLAPTSAKYLTLKASALGQSSGYGGDEALQAPLTKKINTLDKKWGYIARINLAQNQDNLVSGKALSLESVKQFPNDFYILERAAQFFWTTREYSLSQKYFNLACQNFPTKGWHDQIDWFNACYQVAVFAKKEEQSKEKAINAIRILLDRYKLPTKTNFDIAELLYSFANKDSIDIVEPLLSEIIFSSSDKKLVKKAKILLNKYNNYA